MTETDGGTERVRVLVSGRVQGVFFRDSVCQRAGELDLSGWVRNLPDGRVEAVFEGPSESVRDMVRWCEQGPPRAEVAEVSTDYESLHGDFNGFEVR